MAPTLTEAENWLKTCVIDEETIEKLAEKLTTKMDDWHQITDEKTAESIWVILTEAARTGSLSPNLGDGDVAQRVGRVFEKYRSKLAAEIQSIGWSYDEIVDFDVQVSKLNKSSLLESSSAPRTVLTLKVLKTGSTSIRELRVDFDEPQLEEFIWRLEEAKTMRERIRKRV